MHLFCLFLCLKKVTQHAFVYDSHFLTKYKGEFCGVIINNRLYAPICLLEENDRKDKALLENMLRKLSDGKCIVKYALKVTAHDST